MGFNVQLIDPTTGASEYGANIAQWDWKPFSDAMTAAKTTHSMLSQNQQNQRENEDMEMKKLLFPTLQKKQELDLSKIQSEIRETDARADYLLGKSDADKLGSSSFSAAAMKERFGSIFNNTRLFGAPSTKGSGNFSSINLNGDPW